jgi:hypothetical protein
MLLRGEKTVGLAKRLMMECEERGYGTSDKKVCSCCVQDEYLKKLIQLNGEKGKCDYCKTKNGKPVTSRKVITVEQLMSFMMPAIRIYYQRADGNLPYDSEVGEYCGNVIDPYNFVHDILEEYIETPHDELLDELTDILNFDDRTEADDIYARAYEQDIEKWKLFCNLVNDREESVEQIVALCFRDDAPDDLKRIGRIMQGVLDSTIKMNMTDTIRPTNSIYRAVNYLKMGTVTPGFDRIVAGTIGTPPAKFVKNNRFSEEGDMMFYGACNQTILKREVTKTKNPYTIGTFHTNKRINVLNFSGIQLWKKPSIFDLENKETRDSWFFLDSFIRMISKDIQSSQSEKEYKPTQVFTKFIQRYTKYYGIEYRSSKSDATDNNKAVVRDRCYVLFATNRDCIDECERAVKLDQKRLQMIMETYVQV